MEFSQKIIKPRNISYLLIIVWLGFITFLVVDSITILGTNDIGPLQTITQSSFARGMFADIGILSTIFAAWIAFATKVKSRYIFAVASIFVGSIAILPFLAIYLWNAD